MNAYPIFILDHLNKNTPMHLNPSKRPIHMQDIGLEWVGFSIGGHCFGVPPIPILGGKVPVLVTKIPSSQITQGVMWAISSVSFLSLHVPEKGQRFLSAVSELEDTHPPTLSLFLFLSPGTEGKESRLKGCNGESPDKSGELLDLTES